MELQQPGMRPREFRCIRCGAKVQEEEYGNGFKDCGFLAYGGIQLWMCSKCSDLSIEFLGLTKKQAIGLTNGLPIEAVKKEG